MNTLNRILVISLLVLATVACCVLLVGGRWVLPAIAGWVEALAGSVEDANPYAAVGIGAAIAFVVDLVLVLLIILEVRPRRRRYIRAEQAGGGEVEVSVASIANRLGHEINALPGVLAVKTTVKGRRRGVAIVLDVDVAAGLDLPPQAEQIVETVRRVVEENLGLRIARPPRVHVRTVPYPRVVERRRPSEPPVPSGKSPEFAPIEPPGPSGDWQVEWDDAAGSPEEGGG